MPVRHPIALTNLYLGALSKSAEDLRCHGSLKTCMDLIVLADESKRTVTHTWRIVYLGVSTILINQATFLHMISNESNLFKMSSSSTPFSMVINTATDTTPVKCMGIPEITSQAVTVR